jgi:nucleoid-associated protein YgaU
MKLQNKAAVVLLTGAMAFSLATAVHAQDEEMTMEQYEAQLADWQKREADAQAAIEQCESEISSLKQEISSVNDQSSSVWNEIYALVGTDESGVAAYRNQLNGLQSEIDGLNALSPEELFKARADLEAAESRLNSMKESKVYALTEMQNKVADIEGQIARLRDKMPKAIYDEYTVVRGDYLWKIARKGDVYGDPFQWIRIYSYNRDQIDDPDMIFPNQVFKIQREVGPDEYLVKRGDYLYRISGDNMGDPSQWTKVFEQNRNVIGDDPNMIYPYQVLKIGQ